MIVAADSYCKRDAFGYPFFVFLVFLTNSQFDSHTDGALLSAVAFFAIKKVNSAYIVLGGAVLGYVLSLI